ncbi:MAG TPA: Hpt domain-containing protein [Campylobacterales bacterium]|nr:Hpt domain-containing protein [Campylobacterales bacterium]HIP40960.1 Hpt domain-containing protein [Campylobacterales bacterium]
MYYGYNEKNELILADKAFIELLGYQTFDALLKDNVIQDIQLSSSKLILNQSYKKIEANIQETSLYMSTQMVKLVKLSNIIENSSEIKNLQINYKPIYLNAERISKDIGLGVDDYKLYLDSFIDQSIIDEKRLQEGDDKVVKNLSNLALTLKIPNINILLLKIKKLPKSERLAFVDEYYTKLALLTLKKPAGYQDEELLLEEDTPLISKEEELNSKFTELLTTVDIKEKKEQEKKSQQHLSTPEISENRLYPLDEKEIFDLEEQLEPIPDTFSLKEFSLDNVTALPINYNPKIAADELNLPVVLIKEFVEDFIEQAHHDKDHLLASYHQKDMDNIHELGHKLKGAASNLRIDELADVLEEIQFCTDYSKLELLFTKYWGLFISLEDYMHQSK